MGPCLNQPTRSSHVFRSTRYSSPVPRGRCACMPPGANFCLGSSNITSCFTSSKSGRSLTLRPARLARPGVSSAAIALRSERSRDFMAWKACSTVGYPMPMSHRTRAGWKSLKANLLMRPSRLRVVRCRTSSRAAHRRWATHHRARQAAHRRWATLVTTRSEPRVAPGPRLP
jgi:hypothetical protein